MGNIFNASNNTNEQLFGVKVNSSKYGQAIPLIMGTQKTNQLVFWTDGFTSNPVSKKNGGGGKGGGKSGNYTYAADVICGLCIGEISAIGDVWQGQAWLASTNTSETYTVASPYTYTPTNASAFTMDNGVSPASTYTGTYNDYSSPTETVVSNPTSVPFNRVPYGTTPSPGQYSINPANNQYTFSAGDVGTTVTMSYSYIITNITNQENDIVPSSCQIEVGGNLQFNSDGGVSYGGTGSNMGTALTRVNGTPTQAGTYSVGGSAPATYTFASADIGSLVVITYQIYNPNAVDQTQATTLDFSLTNGAIGQSPFSYLTSSYPGAAIGYSGVACVLFEPMDLGSAGEIAQINYEVITPDRVGGVYADGTPILDCNPVHCIYRVLTDPVTGLGNGPVPFPVSFIDNGVGGTWGAVGTPAQQSINSSAWNWFASNNFFISPMIDSSTSADSAMSKWLEAGQCASFVSEGLLKLVPYGDTTTAGNGYTWKAPSEYAAALDDTCFIAKENSDPVQIKRTSYQDAFNMVQIQWNNRKNQYSKEITQETDQSLIDRYGLRIEDPVDYSFIHTLTASTFAANLRLKHITYIRNTYEFVLPFTYSYLEPMDIVTLTTSSVWAQNVNNANLGVVNLPVRITKIVDDPTEGIKVTCEDYPFGAGQPTLFNKGQSAAEVLTDAYATPGTSEIVMFEAAGRLVGYSGNQIWVGACGTSKNYGSTNVWVSQDNASYIQVATISHPAVIGKLTAAFPAGSDPDTTDSLVVQLAENSALLASGTSTAADNDTMLCYVDGEVISYSSAAITGQNTYTLGSYIRRGQLGTTIGSHAIGSLFMRLDGSIFKYTYDPLWQGKTIYFKFQAVNNFGNNPQDLSSLTPVSFTIGSTNSGAVDASSGLLTTGTPDNTVAKIDGGINVLQGSTGVNAVPPNYILANPTSVSTTPIWTDLNTAATAAGVGSQANSVDYLTNADKISLMAQYNAELATQTQLDSKANTLTVSTTTYDSSITAIGTTLVNAGAPSNWATSWPDGTTSGPWPGIMTNLASDWAQVKADRAELQALISNAQAGLAADAALATAETAANTAASNAQAAATAAAATDATTKMNTAITTAQDLAPVIVSGLPTLPNSSYPSGKIVYNSADGQLYTNHLGSWVVNVVASGNITGTLTANQIASVNAASVGSGLTYNQIASVSAAVISGTLTDSQLSSISAAKVTGVLTANQIASVNAATVEGGLNASQISSVNAASLIGAVGSGNICYNCDFAINSGGVPSGFQVYNGGGISITSTINPGGALGNAPFWRLLANAAVNNTFGILFDTAVSDFGGWKPSTNYVVSFYARMSENAYHSTMEMVWNENPATETWLQCPILSTSWQRYAVLINFGTNTIDTQGYFSINPGECNSGDYLDFSCLQVEQGDTLSGWSGPITANLIAANTITSAQIASVNASAVGAGLTAAQIASVSASTVTGTLTDSQIASLSASKLTGSLSSTVTLPTTQLTGEIQASQIQANSIGAGQIAAGSITAAQIESGTITSTQIAANTITAGQIAANTITAAQIASETITAAQIAANTITSSNIVAGSIVGSSLTANTITAAQIASETITAAQIAASTITAGQIASETITTGNIAAGAVTAGQIAANTITAGQIASNTITSSNIEAGSIVGSSIAASTITGANIAGQTITGSNMVANTVTAGQIASGTITATQIAANTITGANIVAGSITGNSLAASTITGTQIASETITAANIASNTITAGQIAAGAIGANQIAANSITAAALTVADWTNLCYNPGFETGTLAQWVSQIPSSVARSTTMAHSGTYSMVMVNNGGTYQVLNQNVIPATAGQVFLLQVWAIADAAITSGTAALRIVYNLSNGSQTSAETDFVPTTTWEQYSVTFTNPANCVSVQCALIDYSMVGGNVYMDDCYFRRCDDASLIVDGSITASKIAAGAITATQMATTALSVGGTGAGPTEIVVMDPSSNRYAEVGEMSGTGPWGGQYGGWFKNLGIGGASPASPNLWIDDTGNMVGANGLAIDLSGNVKLKNIVSEYGVTANPRVGTSFADLPELGTSNAGMTIVTKGNPLLISTNLTFTCATSSGNTGPVTSIGYSPSIEVMGSHPYIAISISGDGSGAYAAVQWTQKPNGYWVPNLTITGGNGYTAATATVTITNGDVTYPNGVTQYTCTITLGSPVVGCPLMLQILMDSNPVLGVVSLVSDSGGNVSYNGTQMVFTAAGSHSFEVQAYTTNSTAYVLSTNRTFNLVELG